MPVSKRLLYIDFETQSEVDIKQAGSYPYVQGDAFKPVSMAYGFDLDNLNIWEGNPANFPHDTVTGNTLAVFNCEFEMNVLNSRWAEIYLELNKKFVPHDFVDVQAVARTFGFPSALDKLAKALGVAHQKDARGTRLINTLCVIKNIFKVPNRESHFRKFKELDAYCLQDVRTTIACHKALVREDLSIPEQQVFADMLVSNQRGLPIDVDSVMAILDMLESFITSQNKKLSILTNGEVTKGTQTARLVKYLGVANLQARTVEQYLNQDTFPEHKKEVLRIRQNTGRSSTAKYKRLLVMLCKDKRIRGTLKYYGGHTGRFAGVGFQLHNLPRAKHDNPDEVIHDIKYLSLNSLIAKYGNLSQTASGLIRPMIKAPKGKRLCVADYVSVENVLLHWVANDMRTTKDFANGLDQYRVFASHRFNVPYQEVTKGQRNYSKPCVLGLGYGGGAGALQVVAKNYGVNLDDASAEADKKFYRNLYPEIPDLWYIVNDYICTAVRDETMLTLDTGTVKMHFIKRGQYAFIMLPSGRYLCYPLPKLEYDRHFDSYTISYMGVNSYTKKWCRLGDIEKGAMGIHGGRLVENIIQALARDLLVKGISSAESAGYKTIGSVHDEIIAEVSKHDVNVGLFEEIISEVPEWAKGLPLRAEGYIAKRYKKD